MGYSLEVSGRQGQWVVRLMGLSVLWPFGVQEESHEGLSKGVSFGLGTVVPGPERS